MSCVHGKDCYDPASSLRDAVQSSEQVGEKDDKPLVYGSLVNEYRMNEGSKSTPKCPEEDCMNEYIWRSVNYLTEEVVDLQMKGWILGTCTSVQHAHVYRWMCKKK